MTKIEEFNNMLQAFASDFELAEENPEMLLILKGYIEGKNEKFLKDINLLSELAYLLRANKIKIIEVENEI